MSEPEASVVEAQAYLHTQMRLTVETDVGLMGRLPGSVCDSHSVGCSVFSEHHSNFKIIFFSLTTRSI